MTIMLGFALPASATMVSTERTQTTLISEVKTFHAGEKFWVVLHIEMKPGWHTYWINPGDSGIPPQLKWTLPNGFVAGPTQYLAPDRETIGPLVDYAYDKDAYYLVSITPPSVVSSNTTAILALKATWLVCKDICIPESGALSLALPAGDKSEQGDDAPQVADLVSRLPMPITGTVTFHKVKGAIDFDVPLKETGVAAGDIGSALFFPESDGLINNEAVQNVTIKPDMISFDIKQAEGDIKDSDPGVLSLALAKGGRKDFELHLQSETTAAQVSAVESVPPEQRTPIAASLPSDTPPEQVTLGKALLYALLGGLILNCMPCVFPVLSLKALAVAKKAWAHPSEARRQGIAYAVGVIASFLVLAFALLVVQRSGQEAGWGYQMQSPPFVAMLALLLFAVALNLAGYFELPVVFGNVGQETASKDNAWGSLFTGVLAVMVATPCSAPFMASAISFALTQNAPVIFTVFAALGLGLASPFLLVSFFPRLIRVLPKPGAWMITFKELLSFPMFGWTVWLLWVLAREAGGNAVCIVLIGMILIAFAIWLWRHGGALVKALALIVGTLGIASAVAATQMPMPVAASVAQGAEKFTPAKLAKLRKAGKAVFVDATADWCLICKVNETVALSSAEVKQKFKDRQVAYLIADWTHGDDDITRYLSSFGRSGVPIYVYYPPGDVSPVVLPQVLTPATVLQVVQ